MKDKSKPPHSHRWAIFRFSIVGPLLSAVPQSRALRKALEVLSEKMWRHPLSDKPVKFSFSTIEKWYYLARRDDDPVSALKQSCRKDHGKQKVMNEALQQVLKAQYESHKSWSYQLHYDNLKAEVISSEHLGRLPSYSTVRRFMKARGFVRLKGCVRRQTAGALKAEARLIAREVRSYEVSHVHGLWHLDFHHGSRQVLTKLGEWKTPILLGILDDHSRLACHLQWYLSETAEDLAHGFSQACQKRGLPRALMTDNGAAMTSAEFKEGLEHLGIIQEFTLPYSPYQNGKQETFWSQVEGRLMAMLENKRELTLDLLNQATMSWSEIGYNRKFHSEIKETPYERHSKSPDVSRASPSSEELKLCFTTHEKRTQRRSDGTISLMSKRFEIPSRYRQLEHVAIRFARWDLSFVYLSDPHNGNILCRIHQQDKTKNSDSRRKTLDRAGVADEPSAQSKNHIAPLLKKFMVDYSATGNPPAYIPQHKKSRKETS